MKVTSLALFLGTAMGAKFLNVKEPIDGSYIVVLKKGLEKATVAKHFEAMQAQNVSVVRKYSIGEFQGYNAHVNKADLLSLLDVDEVDFVEEDMVVRTNCQSQAGPTWGISRTSAGNSWSGGSRPDYEYVSDSGDGTDVTVYVIDTGVRITHNEFGGRATAPGDANFINPGQPATDGNGHGTHCAGTVAGSTYGMAKNANIVGVKVLSDGGSGSTAGVIGGVDWSADSRRPAGPKVLSMSLGGGSSAAMNNAVIAATNAGSHVVVAAGNDNRDACGYSPAGAGGSATNVISVVASDDRDARSSFSNYGTCTDIIAPGSGITAAWIGNDAAVSTISGTSMACPHVAGMLAKYLTNSTNGVGNDVPRDAKEWLLNTALDGAITSLPTGSPNKLLHGDCADFTPQR